MENIKNIIFDLGGVVLNIDYQLTINAFNQLGFKNFEKIFSQAKQRNEMDWFETGAKDRYFFYDYIRQHIEASDEEIKSAWNAILLDLPQHRLTALEKLKTKYRIFLLSNTNEIHVEAFSIIIDKTFGLDNWNKLFEGVYYSNEIGLRKPDKACFKFVLESNGLSPEETLFIDDSIQHVRSASEMGIQCHHLVNQEFASLFPDTTR